MLGGMAAKRLIDVFCATLLLLVLTPILIVVVAAMAVDMLLVPRDRGGFLYREPRISLGRTFGLLKFRTLRNDVLADLRRVGSHARLYEAEQNNLTWTGRRLLKPWYLDELPQLLNVLRGDISLVGPRPWPPEMVERQVAEGLTYRNEARAEQASSGRLLGQILVNNGYLSAFSLARVLSEQHGVQLQAREDEAAEQTKTAHVQPVQAWRPLGKLLVELGLVTESQLERALAHQSEEHGRLGEILVSRGLLSGSELAQALAEQHGVELEPQDEAELQTQVRPATPDEPVYQVFEVAFEPGYQRRTALYENANFLEAADF